MQKKQGISLIVLVITIIVMTILAGAIILTLNNSGIINKATDAVEQSNLATVKELTQMAWAEAYAGGERTEEGLKAAVDKALEDNKVDGAKYIIEVTTSGVTVELKGETKVKWVQQGLTVTNGTVTLEIGDSIAYDETNGGKETGLTATDWKVLGASEQGELLIMSTVDIAIQMLGDETHGGDLDEAVNDWLNGVAELDALCEPYGKGEGATGARSVRVEDVDKITGYDKTTYYPEELCGYGNEVTYTLDGSTLKAVGTNGKNNTVEYYTDDYGSFWYYNGSLPLAILADGKSVTIKSDCYYYAPDLDTIEHGSKAYTMLFGEDDTYYWLASPYVATGPDSVSFGMRVLRNGISGEYFWDSIGDPNGDESGVRAVVSLASDINITGSSASGWTY